MMRWNEPRSLKICKGCGSRYRSAFSDGLNCISCETGICYLYVIACGDFVKVGHTNNIHSRVSCMRSSCPFPVQLVFKERKSDWIDARESERALHDKLYSEIHRNEWFRYSAKTKRILKEYK
jgi:hypothetical protein